MSARVWPEPGRGGGVMSARVRPEPGRGGGVTRALEWGP